MKAARGLLEQATAGDEEHVRLRDRLTRAAMATEAENAERARVAFGKDALGARSRGDRESRQRVAEREERGGRVAPHAAATGDADGALCLLQEACSEGERASEGVLMMAHHAETPRL